MYVIKILREKSQFADFNRKFLESGGSSPADEAWLLASTVVGVFERGELVAGYVESSPPTRSISQVPESERERLLLSEVKKSSQIREIAAFWIDKNKRGPSLQAFVWWSFVLRYVFFSRKHFVLGMANVDKISARYEAMCGKIIWDAPSEVYPGQRYKVFLWSRALFFRVAARLFCGFFAQVFSRRPRGRGKNYETAAVAREQGEVGKNLK